jgi:GntR family transcriptional repressor for pyruvate dehydrogenase complex
MAKLQSQHHGIMDAITAGRAEDAAALTEEHIRFAAARLPGLSDT